MIKSRTIAGHAKFCDYGNIDVISECRPIRRRSDRAIIFTNMVYHLYLDALELFMCSVVNKIFLYSLERFLNELNFRQCKERKRDENGNTKVDE